MQRTSYIFSASLHAGILAVAMFGLPYFEFPHEPPPPVVLAEFAPIADKTNVPKPQPKVTPAKAPPKEEPAPEAKPEPKPEPPKPQPAAVAPPPPPPPPKVEPPKQVAEAPKPASQPEPEPEPAPKAAPKKAAEVPKPVAKPTPPKPQVPVQQKSKTPNFADVAALVNKMQKAPAPQPSQETKTASRPAPAAAPRAEGPSNPNLPLSMSEKDFIRKQVEDQWLFDLGAKDAETLIVRIRFSLNPDGSLKRQPEIVDQARMYLPGNESYRSAAESARRAVLKAVPFRLPPGDPEKWGQDIILNFDPRQMLGG